MHYPVLGSASDWSCRLGNLTQPIRSTTQIRVVTRHRYGISTLVSQTSFGGESSDSVANVGWFLRPTSTNNSRDVHIIQQLKHSIGKVRLFLSQLAHVKFENSKTLALKTVKWAQKKITPKNKQVFPITPQTLFKNCFS